MARIKRLNTALIRIGTAEERMNPESEVSTCPHHALSMK